MGRYVVSKIGYVAAMKLHKKGRDDWRRPASMAWLASAPCIASISAFRGGHKTVCSSYEAAI
jgi:hypothetical protein